MPIGYTDARLVKRRGALLRSDPTRDSQVRAERVSAGPAVSDGGALSSLHPFFLAPHASEHLILLRLALP